ncbi:MAG: FixH family protein [Gemmatimonadaceae bacterium]
MKRGMWWPIGITIVLSLVVISNVWIAIVASDPNALAVEPDYYEKAVHFDSTMQQEARNTRLGWQLVPSLGAVSPDSGAELRVALHDERGAPLAGATVRVVAIHNAIANTPVSGTLGDRGNGEYSARLPLHRRGQWELTFDVQRGAERFTADLRLDAAGPSRS